MCIEAASFVSESTTWITYERPNDVHSSINAAAVFIFTSSLVFTAKRTSSSTWTKAISTEPSHNYAGFFFPFFLLYVVVVCVKEIINIGIIKMDLTHKGCDFHMHRTSFPLPLQIKAAFFQFSSSFHQWQQTIVYAQLFGTNSVMNANVLFGV